MHMNTIASSYYKCHLPPQVSAGRGPTHNGAIIPPWTETGKEYLVLERFPHLRARLEGGLDCLSPEDRIQLHCLCEQRREEVTGGPLHGKVSLLVGGNLAHVEVDAVVNASNHWLTTGKGRVVYYTLFQAGMGFIHQNKNRK